MATRRGIFCYHLQCHNQNPYSNKGVILGRFPQDTLILYHPPPKKKLLPLIFLLCIQPVFLKTQKETFIQQPILYAQSVKNTLPPTPSKKKTFNRANFLVFNESKNKISPPSPPKPGAKISSPTSLGRCLEDAIPIALLGRRYQQAIGLHGITQDLLRTGMDGMGKGGFIPGKVGRCSSLCMSCFSWIFLEGIS